MFEQRGSRYEAEVLSRCEGSTLYRLPESESCGLVPVCFLYILCRRLWDGINNRVKEIDDENVLDLASSTFQHPSCQGYTTIHRYV